MMYIIVLIRILLGLGIFLFGMYFMNDAIKRMALRRVKRMFARVSENVLANIFLGFLITVFSGSSSGVIIMIISFIDAGIIDLGQAAAIIMGSNIGTTVTANVLAFNVFDFTIYFIPIGVLGYILGRNIMIRRLSQFIISIGLLFYGINYMSHSLIPLKKNLDFVRILRDIGGKPLEGLLLGVLLVAVIQSSTAGIAMLQSFARAGLISTMGAAPMVFGQNISTCFDTLVAAIMTRDKKAKGAAYFHLLFNVFGTIIFMLLLKPLVNLSIILSGEDPAEQIAMVHTLFNVGTTLILLPFFKYIVVSLQL
ncbi:Na/Pi-cotransporter [Caldanaerobius fijiensis DSM 17918]|uniref:Na/Pi-cotransporter n=1 Tax=Caldanaerobius fijiensis DSM 17918 TaxID=1121256 RepID=A0A1M5BF87_9THEO|nr:Na/Pi symporter [Caldanaerobius fijiensis]SHF41164.1 Na/Pi-cotransporter [Caldanaerobius fijiensis DSM 17918]